MVRKQVAKDPVQFAVLMKLSSLKEKIAVRDLEFARSLVTNFNKYGRLSDKQIYFVEQIINRAEAPAPEVVQLSVTRILDMFANAAVTLRRIKVTLKDAAGQKVVFKRAGSTSSYAGQIMISDGEAFGTAQFFGRIELNGRYVPSSKATDTIKALIKEFSEDPEATAGKYGRLTGGCCFCSKPLNDQRSLVVGYGPVCAKHFGLKWGK